MAIFFFIIGGAIFIPALIFFISSRGCLKDEETLKILQEMLEEDGNYIPEEVLLARIKKTFDLSLLALAVSILLITAGVLFIVL